MDAPVFADIIGPIPPRPGVCMAATKVLVVDDDLNIQRVLVFTLKQEGFEVHVASDGQAGVEMAASIQPDLILMDVAMPKIDGYAATQQIRAAEDGRRVPIIMLTAEADVEQRVKGLRAGADDDIVKPFHPLELIARIKALLARSGGGLEEDPGEARPSDASPASTARRAAWAPRRSPSTRRSRYRAAQPQDTPHRRQPPVRRHARLPRPGLDSSSIVNAISEPDLDAELLKKLIIPHHAGIDLLLAPPNPETADIVAERQRTDPRSLSNILSLMRKAYDYTIVDMAKTIDDFNLQLFDESDVIFVVMTADLSCLKNVRLVLETMDSLGYERARSSSS